MNGSEFEALCIYVKYMEYEKEASLKEIVNDFRNSYQSEWGSKEDFARELAHDTNSKINLNDEEEFKNYVDELFLYDFYYEDGYVFLQ